MNEYLLKKTFAELKGFIDACLNNTRLPDEQDNLYLTTDRQTLLEIADRLSFLADDERIKIYPPDFVHWKVPASLKHAKSKKEQAIIIRLQALEHQRHLDYLQFRREFNSIVEELNEELRNRHKVVAEIFKAIEKQTLNQLRRNVITVPWKLLPESTEGRFSLILSHYQSLQASDPNTEYDIERLYKVNELNADAIYIGTDEFKGYVVFYFDRGETAVLECPKHGNAIYVFKKDWQAFSRLSKAALLGNHADYIQRIIHSGDWFSRLEWLVRTRQRLSKKPSRELSKGES